MPLSLSILRATSAPVIPEDRRTFENFLNLRLSDAETIQLAKAVPMKIIQYILFSFNFGDQCLFDVVDVFMICQICCHVRCTDELSRGVLFVV